MSKIIMLGTGHGSVVNDYNTCFILENSNDFLLVDTGGSIKIIDYLEKVGISIYDVHNIFISHSHTDHLLGLIWLFKVVMLKRISGEINSIINVFCNEEVMLALDNVFKVVYPIELYEVVKKYTNIKILHDNENIEIAGLKFNFFDAKSKSNLLYGFETCVNKKKLVFLGDETCNKDIYSRINGADYVMHEAFCLDSDSNLPDIIKKRHSTVKDVCLNMNKMSVKNLIIFHTEDSHGKDKKTIYELEGKKFFKGNIIVPNDLDVIDLGDE